MCVNDAALLSCLWHWLLSWWLIAAGHYYMPLHYSVLRDAPSDWMIEFYFCFLLFPRMMPLRCKSFHWNLPEFAVLELRLNPGLPTWPRLHSSKLSQLYAPEPIWCSTPLSWELIIPKTIMTALSSNANEPPRYWFDPFWSSSSSILCAWHPPFGSTSSTSSMSVRWSLRVCRSVAAA